MTTVLSLSTLKVPIVAIAPHLPALFEEPGRQDRVREAVRRRYVAGHTRAIRGKNAGVKGRIVRSVVVDELGDDQVHACVVGIDSHALQLRVAQHGTRTEVLLQRVGARVIDRPEEKIGLKEGYQRHDLTSPLL